MNELIKIEELTMTTDELTCSLGKSRDTIIRTAKKLGMLFESRKVRKFNKDEVSRVAISLYPKEPLWIKQSIDHIFGQLTQTRQTTNANASDLVTPRQSADLNAKVIKTIVETTIKATMDTMIKTLPFVLSQYGFERKQLPAPIKEPRDYFNQIVRQYAADKQMDHCKVYGVIYNEFYYRLHINVGVRAKAEGISSIEYLEKNGLLDKAILIAKEIFNRKGVN